MEEFSLYDDDQPMPPPELGTRPMIERIPAPAAFGENPLLIPRVIAVSVELLLRPCYLDRVRDALIEAQLKSIGDTQPTMRALVTREVHRIVTKDSPAWRTIFDFYQGRGSLERLVAVLAARLSSCKLTLEQLQPVFIDDSVLTFLAELRRLNPVLAEIVALDPHAAKHPELEPWLQPTVSRLIDTRNPITMLDKVRAADRVNLFALHEVVVISHRRPLLNCCGNLGSQALSLVSPGQAAWRELFDSLDDTQFICPASS